MLGVYTDAEHYLLGSVTDEVAGVAELADRYGPDSDEVDAARVAGMRRVRKAVDHAVTGLDADGPGRVERIIAAGAESGVDEATRQLRELGHDPADLAPQGYRDPVNRAALDRLAASTVSVLTEAHSSILRTVPDAFQRVVSRVVSAVLVGAETRLEASQRALWALLDEGFTGFTDRAGRKWKLSSYVEMAVRTAAARAHVDAQLDQLGALGVDLVQVSDSGRECSKCRPWEGRVLTTQRGYSKGDRIRVEDLIEDGKYHEVQIDGTVADARKAGLLHPNCFPGDTLVSAPSGVRAADSRWYEGPVVVVHTARGDELTVTPNHPVLTPEGWVAAGALAVGDHVIRHPLDVEREGGVSPDHDRVPAPIGQVFETLRESGAVTTVRVPAAPEQFHGDGLDGHVDVVLADGALRHGVEPTGTQRVGDPTFVGGRAGQGARLPDGAGFEIAGRPSHAAHCVVGGGGQLGTLGGGQAGETPTHGFPAADPGTALDDPTAHGGLADTEDGRELALRLAVVIAPDEVVHVGRREFAGHVFNLQTVDGWYVAAGIVVHNCRHNLSAYLPGASDDDLLPPPRQREDPKGEQADQRQREIERGIRKWKERRTAAVDEHERRAADRKVRDWQAKMREHLAAHPQLRRLPYREGPGAGNVPSAARKAELGRPIPGEPTRAERAAKPTTKPTAKRAGRLKAVDPKPGTQRAEPMTRGQVESKANQLSGLDARKRGAELKALDVPTLKALDREYSRRANLLGKTGQKSRAHAAVRRELGKR